LIRLTSARDAVVSAALVKSLTERWEADDVPGDEHTAADGFAALDPIAHVQERLQRPHESNTVVKPFLSVTCAASSISSS
jgi:hypothetical protein